MDLNGAVRPKAKNPELLNLDEVKLDPAWVQKVPASLALRRRVLAFARVDGKVLVACAVIPDKGTIQALRRGFENEEIEVLRAEPESLQRALTRIYGTSASRASGSHRGLKKVEIAEDGAVSLGEDVLQAAILREASDIHFEPRADQPRIRFRVDGKLEEFQRVGHDAYRGLLTRFKVLAGMDIAEKRAPQDGRFTHVHPQSQRRIDLRAATLPTNHGERLTLRLLALQTEGLTLERLGMMPRDLELFDTYLRKPHGLMLVTGPTGSGKSTTLYAALRRLLAIDAFNIITIEDPIEYDIPSVSQVEVDSADKVSFAKALRSTLRHDPDVVMIGEIRDLETADVANKAALTGHLVLSTLHTNSAVSVITRLADMGVDRFLIAATLRLAAAQRLVRRLCPRCCKEVPFPEAEAWVFQRPELAEHSIYEPVGCRYCAGRGFIGRIGVFELLGFNEEWSRNIAQNVDEADLLKEMRERGVPTLMDDALAKMLSGDTCLEEVLAAVTAW